MMSFDNGRYIGYIANNIDYYDRQLNVKNEVAVSMFYIIGAYNSSIKKHDEQQINWDETHELGMLRVVY